VQTTVVFRSGFVAEELLEGVGITRRFENMGCGAKA
jgi:hypothetical protein